MHADGFSRHSDDYDTPDGRDDQLLAARQGRCAGWRLDRRRQLASGWVSCVTNPATAFPARRPTSTWSRPSCSLRSSFDLDAGPWRKLTVDAGWADYEHSERDEDGVALATFKDDEWDARAEAVAGPWGVLSESALGVQLQQRDFSALGEGEEYLSPTRTAEPGRCSASPRARSAERCACSSARAWSAWRSTARQRRMSPRRAASRRSAPRPGWCSMPADAWRAGACRSRPRRARRRRPSCLRAACTRRPPPSRPACPSLRQERANSVGAQPALARRARACRWRAVGHGLQQLHLRRADRAHLQ